jgi:CTP:molybdopterin cytidylyltransferase MocA
MGLMSHESEAKSVRIVAPVEGLLLAAGLSTRMGDFKLTLPWDGTTVIGRVTQTLREAGLADILVVTGHRSDDVVRALAGKAVRTVHNPEYGTGEMLTSVQVGLRALQPNTVAALLCLGDQPQMEVTTVLAAQLPEAGRTSDPTTSRPLASGMEDKRNIEECVDGKWDSDPIHQRRYSHDPR